MGDVTESRQWADSVKWANWYWLRLTATYRLIATVLALFPGWYVADETKSQIYGLVKKCSKHRQCFVGHYMLGGGGGLILTGRSETIPFVSSLLALSDKLWPIAESCWPSITNCSPATLVNSSPFCWFSPRQLLTWKTTSLHSGYCWPVYLTVKKKKCLGLGRDYIRLAT